jgi:hypothetical protein
MQGIVITTLLALGIAVLTVVLMGPLVIPFLTKLKVGQSIREDGPQRHLRKAGTPTIVRITLRSIYYHNAYQTRIISWCEADEGG